MSTMDENERAAIEALELARRRELTMDEAYASCITAISSNGMTNWESHKHARRIHEEAVRFAWKMVANLDETHPIRLAFEAGRYDYEYDNR